eukprot:Skav229012  [mRNA]  locus=scaffold127:438297:440283:- [translate_table: standard]
MLPTLRLPFFKSPRNPWRILEDAAYDDSKRALRSPKSYGEEEEEEGKVLLRHVDRADGVLRTYEDQIGCGNAWIQQRFVERAAKELAPRVAKFFCCAVPSTRQHRRRKPCASTHGSSMKLLHVPSPGDVAPLRSDVVENGALKFTGFE